MKTYLKTNYWFNRNRILSHLSKSFLALAIAGASLTLSSAEASRPAPANGGFFPCFTYAGPPRQVGDNTIVTFNVTTTATGTFDGTLEGTELDIIHPDGSMGTLYGTAVFTGSVGNRSGTLLFLYTGRGNVNTGHETLSFVGVYGTDGLTGMHAQGTAEGDLGSECDGDFGGHGTYHGQIVFTP